MFKSHPQSLELLTSYWKNQNEEGVFIRDILDIHDPLRRGFPLTSRLKVPVVFLDLVDRRKRRDAL